jgi:two-component system LytT family response regulator
VEKIRAIIVDDEPEAREIMMHLLTDLEEVEILARDSNVEDAYQSVATHKPDLVFLDIAMPEKDGFSLLSKLKESEHTPSIIFVTAYNQFAIKAIKHAAFDYLMKPVDVDELRQSIVRFKKERHAQASLSRIENLLQALQEEKLCFNSRTGSVYLNPADIVYSEADGNYSILHLFDRKKITLTINIGRLLESLPPMKFSKISRSLIINKQYLSEVNRKEKTCILKVNDEEIRLNLSSRYLQSLRSD